MHSPARLAVEEHAPGLDQGKLALTANHEPAAVSEVLELLHLLVVEPDGEVPAEDVDRTSNHFPRDGLVPEA